MFTLPILIFLNESCPMFIICFCFCFVVFSVHSNCSEIWGLSTPNTIEQWDTSGLYSYPDQTRWLSSTIVWCCVQLWCGRVVITMLEVSDTTSLFLVLITTQSFPSPFPSPTQPYYVSPPLPFVSFTHLTTISCLLFNQITGWPPAGLPQEGASSCYLLPLVAMAWPSQPSRAASHRGLWVCLPPQKGWGLHQPLPLPEGGDPRWDPSGHLLLLKQAHFSLFLPLSECLVATV